MKEFKYTLEQIKGMLKEMVILVDSREKLNSHILGYFQRQGISYEITKLDFGDYSCKIPASAAGRDIYFHDSIVIERKNSLEEISGNLTKGREAFEREFMRAKASGAKIYLLVESPGGYSDIIGHKYRTEFKPAAFSASLLTWESRFDVNVRFIDKQYSGYYVFNTLQYFVREALR